MSNTKWSCSGFRPWRSTFALLRPNMFTFVMWHKSYPTRAHGGASKSLCRFNIKTLHQIHLVESHIQVPGWRPCDNIKTCLTAMARIQCVRTGTHRFPPPCVLQNNPVLVFGYWPAFSHSRDPTYSHLPSDINHTRRAHMLGRGIELTVCRTFQGLFLKHEFHHDLHHTNLVQTHVQLLIWRRGFHINTRIATMPRIRCARIGMHRCLPPCRTHNFHLVFGTLVYLFLCLLLLLSLNCLEDRLNHNTHPTWSMIYAI
jgi:hypothetical protein